MFKKKKKSSKPLSFDYADEDDADSDPFANIASSNKTSIKKMKMKQAPDASSLVSDSINNTNNIDQEESTYPSYSVSELAGLKQAQQYIQPKERYD